MTTTENTENTGTFDVSAYPGLAELIEKRPDGVVVIIIDPYGSAARAYKQRTNSSDGSESCYIAHSRLTRDFTGAVWHLSSRGQYGADWKIDEGWREIPLDPGGPAPEPVRELPFTVTQSLVDLVAKRPEGVTLILRDSLDGELRAWADPADVKVLSVHPSGCSTDYTESRWPDGPGRFSASTEPYYDSGCWNEVPLDLAMPPAQPDEAPFGEPAAPVDHSGETELTVLRDRLVADGWTQDEVASCLQATWNDGIPNWLSPEQEQQLRTTLHERAGIPTDPQALLVHTLNKRRQFSDALQEARTATTELEQFKQRVVEVAVNYAEEHNWCTVIDSALAELDLKRPPVRYEAELTIKVMFTAARVDEREVPGRDWVDQSLDTRAIERYITNNLKLDDDSEDVTVTEVTFDVETVERYDD